MIAHYASEYQTLRFVEAALALGHLVGKVHAKDEMGVETNKKAVRVQVYDPRSGRLVAQAWSRSLDRSYRVEGLVAGRKYRLMYKI